MAGDGCKVGMAVASVSKKWRTPARQTRKQHERLRAVYGCSLPAHTLEFLSKQCVYYGQLAAAVFQVTKPTPIYHCRNLLGWPHIARYGTFVHVRLICNHKRNKAAAYVPKMHIKH